MLQSEFKNLKIGFLMIYLPVIFFARAKRLLLCDFLPKTTTWQSKQFRLDFGNKHFKIETI